MKYFIFCYTSLNIHILLNYLNSFSILSAKKFTNLKVSLDRVFHKIIVVILDSVINFHRSLIKMVK